MKKLKTTFFALLFLVILVLPSCATILGGPVSTCQRTKPAPGQPTREIRVGALIADMFIFPGFFIPNLIVDFATGAIYKPCTSK